MGYVCFDGQGLKPSYYNVPGSSFLESELPTARPHRAVFFKVCTVLHIDHPSTRDIIEVYYITLERRLQVINYCKLWTAINSMPIILPTNTCSECRKERNIRISIGPWWPAKAALVRNYLEAYWPCAGELSAVNTIGSKQLTTSSRIGNLTRSIHNLLYVMTIHTYICIQLV